MTLKAISILSLLLVFSGISALSHAQLLRFQEEYKVGYKDAAGNVVVFPVYDAGSEMKEGFAIVMKGGKRGYINAKGAESIACNYEDASLFENGLACVQLNGKYGFINTNAVWVIQPIYDNAFIFKNGLARVCRAQKWGMINPQGAVVIPMLYERLYDITDGLVAASMDGHHYGYIDAKGKVVIDFHFNLALPFDEQLHRAIVTTTKGNFYINKKGAITEQVADNEEEEEHERRK